MTIRYYAEVEQGSDEWHALRCGRLTASEIKLILTPETLKCASSDKSRAHVDELLAQRMSQYVEPHYIGDDMLRGKEDEIYARALYEEQEKQPVDTIGFVTNDQWGFTLGYSPDGLIGTDGLAEFKSRRQGLQIATLATRKVPKEHALQCQAGLLIAADRKWLDYGSYSGGLCMIVLRVWPDDKVQNAIIEAAGETERAIEKRLADIRETIATGTRLFPTERRVEMEIQI